MSTRASNAAAGAFRRGLEQFRAMNAKFPIQWATAFAIVAEAGDMSLGDLERELGVGQTTASMIVLALSTGMRPGEEGLDLLETFPDPEDRRAKRVRLTHKGDRIARALAHALKHAALQHA